MPFIFKERAFVENLTVMNDFDMTKPLALFIHFTIIDGQLACLLVLVGDHRYKIWSSFRKNTYFFQATTRLSCFLCAALGIHSRITSNALAFYHNKLSKTVCSH